MVERLFPALAALAACYSPNAPYGAPCATDTDCPSSQSCDPDTLTCSVATEALLWRDDTAADFGAAGAYIDEVTVEGAGFIGPVGYLSGGVRLTGIDSQSIAATSTTWDEAAARASTGTSLARGLALDFQDGAPPGLGLTKTDDITLLLEGELFLDTAGTWRFELTANDLGFFELAPPGGRGFVRVVADDFTTTIATYEAPAPGWYRFRGAFSDAGMNFRYELRYDKPGPGGLRSIAAADLRAPAGDLGGMLVDGFTNAYMIGPVASVVHAGSLDAQTFTNNPYGLPVGGTSYTLRYAGQVLIDEEGSYSFHVDTSQGSRVWLDGAAVLSDFETAPVAKDTSAVVLQPGWHDLVIDMHKTTGNMARLDVRATGGPWNGVPIPADHLRPVVGRGARWTAVATDAVTAVADGAAGTRTLTLELPSGMATTRIDAAFEIDHPVLSSVEVVLDPPVGVNTTLIAAGSAMGAGAIYRRVSVLPTSSGATWSFIMTDTLADAMTGELNYAAITMIGTGGPAPFPTAYRYLSAPRDLGEIASLSSVRWALRQAGNGGAARVSLRTCDAVEACETEAWTQVTEGARPTAPARRFAQYMVELTGNGNVPTALDWIEIGYRVFDR